MSDRVTGKPTDAEKLAHTVRRLPTPAFAVLDGALWDDLPRELGQAGLSGRSLFLGAGTETEAAGPWLVAMGRRDGDVETILALVGERPAAAYWGCSAGEVALYRHLRTLNQMQMTRPAPESPGEQAVSSPVAEVVLFRHWDPRALGCVLPLLDEFQYARLLGPAEEVAVLDPVPLGGLGVRRAVRLPDLPMAPRGRLTLDAEQIAALDETMQERSRRRVAAYLRDAAPELTGSLSDAALHGRVRQCQATGTALGLSSERAQMKWAYLMVLTDGRAAGTPEVVRFIRSGPSPDAQVDEAMRQVVAAARSHGEQG